MVIRSLALTTVTACILAGCASEGKQPADEPTNRTVVTAADTASATIVPASEARIDAFALRLDSGEVFRYRMTQSAVAGPDSAIAETKSTHTYLKRVKRVRSDGTMEVGMTFESIKVDAIIRNRITNQVLQEQHYSSSDSSQRKDPKYAQFNALLGEEVTITLTPQATIEEISGIKPVVNRMLDVQTQLTPEMRDRARQGLERQVEAAIYATYTEQEYLRFPKKGIDSTQGWDFTADAPLMDLFMIHSEAKYHIDAVKEVKGHRIAEIMATMKGNITTVPLPKTAPVQVKVGRSAIVGTGRTIIDVAKGFTISKHNEVSTSVAATVRNTATGQQEDVSQQTVMRYTVELLR